MEKLPFGVYKHNNSRYFASVFSISENKTIFLGIFSDPASAFQKINNYSQYNQIKNKIFNFGC